jgi:ribosome production factor 1
MAGKAQGGKRKGRDEESGGDSNAAASGKGGERPKISVLDRPNPSHIKNKIKRQQIMAKYRKEKKDLKKANLVKRRREREELGEQAPAKLEPRTIDNTREPEPTMVAADGDDEVVGDEMDDEFAKIFANEETPKLMITTRPFPSGELYHFIKDLMDLIPNAFYYKRGTFDIKDIVQFATNKEFTHLIVLSEKSKICNGCVCPLISLSLSILSTDTVPPVF